MVRHAMASNITRENINETIKKTQIKFNNIFYSESNYYNKLDSSFNELQLSKYYCVPHNYSIEDVCLY